ncbi:MAG: condensation domain-containing protein [Mycobacterium sp.]
MLAGLLDIVRIDEWDPGTGSVTSWHGSPASRAKAMAAPVSTVPASYMQAQHIRGFHEFAERGLDYSRMISVSWDQPGQCDLRAMNYVINAHLRRHDTYRSWFEWKDEGRIVRHTMQNPNDVKFVPTKRGQMSAKDFQQVIQDTPDLNGWDCFQFGIIQYEEHFTFYFIVDHVHVDPMMMGTLYVEIHQIYEMIRQGGAPPALPEPSGYDDFCVRQHQLTSSLSAESPEVRRWVDFTSANDGALPDFALPLGDPDAKCGGAVMVVQLMNGEQTQKFESACIAAGARFVGGVFAAAAVAQYRLTGVDSYFGMTPKDLRTKPEEYVTTGWFTGMIPVDVPVVDGSFAQTVRAAQKSFDGNTDLAQVPFDRVLELVPRLRRSHRGFPMLAYLDAGLPPLSAVVASKAGDANARTFCDGLSPAHICMWVGRVGDETSLTVFYPDNAIARDSVNRYVEAMQEVYVGVAEGREVAVTSMRETA